MINNTKKRKVKANIRLEIHSLKGMSALNFTLLNIQYKEKLLKQIKGHYPILGQLHKVHSKYEVIEEPKW